ncbi:MAG: dihydrofolate reductase family protein [Solirubrobacterales bacterium]
MLRLYPDPGTIELTDAYGDLALAGLAPADRPYVIVNMVQTADGQARIGDDTAELGNEADARLFARLREQVDCVMAGTRTIAIENYNAPARGDDVRERRVGNGLAPRPLFATISRSGVLPLAAPLFQDEGMEIVVFGESEQKLSDLPAAVTRVPETSPVVVLSSLRHRFGVRSLLLEGGPRINAPMFAAGVIDELFLTVAPVLAGADTPFPIVAGSLPRRRRLGLAGALLDEDHLFLRYRVDVD